MKQKKRSDDWVVHDYRCQSCGRSWRMGWSHSHYVQECGGPWFVDACERCGAMTAPIGVEVPKRVARDVLLNLSDEDLEKKRIGRAPLGHLRADVWEKTDGTCYYCRKRLNPFRDFHVDHILPFSRGGSDEIDNLVPSCSACNLSKGARTPGEWR